MNDLQTPRQLLNSFVLEQAQSQPIELRKLIYLALAAESQSKEFKAQCNGLAEHLSEIERKHQQLLLDFKRGAIGR
jgi:hypothetical protein